MAPFSAPFISLDDFFFWQSLMYFASLPRCSTPSAFTWPRKGLTTGFGLKNPCWGSSGLLSCFIIPTLPLPMPALPRLVLQEREAMLLGKGTCCKNWIPPAAPLCWHLLKASEDILSTRALVASPVLRGGSRGFAGSMQPSVTASTQALWQDAACVLLTVGFHCCEAR